MRLPPDNQGNFWNWHQQRILPGGGTATGQRSRLVFGPLLFARKALLF